MKTLVMLIFVSCQCTVVYAFQNEPTGFRGMEWGAPIEAQEGLILVDRAADRAMYRRTSDELRIGEAELQRIQYMFYKGRFAAVIIRTSGATNKAALILAFKTQFGNSMQANRYIDDHIWSGKIATLGVMCGVGNLCSALLTSAALETEQEAARRAAAERGKADF